MTIPRWRVWARYVGLLAKRFDGVANALQRMTWLFLGAVVLMFTLRYVADNVRSTDYWVKYHTVRPARVYQFDPQSPPRVFAIGERPVFFTRAQWFRESVPTSWSDVMWCRMLDGPDKGKRVKFSLEGGSTRYPRKQGLVGFYDETGKPLAGSTDGFWIWGGTIPLYASDCSVDPIPVLYPSPLVERPVDVPRTVEFSFR